MTPSDKPEIWYRYEDRLYANLDEWGDARGDATLKVDLQEFVVLKHTPKGVKIARPFGSYRSSTERFVLSGAHKRFACPTIEEAKESFIARKRKQLRIHQARIKCAQRAIDIISFPPDGISS